MSVFSAITVESALIGSLLIGDKDLIGDIPLKIADFYDLKHQAIFASMLSLSEKEVQVDYTTVALELTMSGKLTNAGGDTYLADCLSNAPAVITWKYHADIIADMSKKRAMATVLETCLESLKDGHGTHEAERLISVHLDTQVATGVKIEMFSDGIAQVVETIERRYESKEMSGVPTGFTELDTMTDGLQQGDLIIIGGRPSMGKSALAMNILENAALQGIPGGMISLEMSQYQLITRILAGKSKIPISYLQKANLQKSQWSSLIQAVGKLSELPLFFTYSAYSDRKIKDSIKAMVKQHGCKIVVVDYLQLGNTEEKTQNREREISTLTRMFKRTAQELNIPIVVLAQLNRQCEMRTDKRPVPADLRESGAIEQDADVIMFLYRDSVYNADAEKGLTEVLVRKGRNCGTGTIKLSFDAVFTKFSDYKEEYDDAF